MGERRKGKYGDLVAVFTAPAHSGPAMDIAITGPALKAAPKRSGITGGSFSALSLVLGEGDTSSGFPLISSSS